MAIIPTIALGRSKPRQPGNGRGRGFTLIEVMITVAIIAIVAGVALPAYQSSVIKGKRAQGRTALLELMQAQERSFTQFNTYTVLSLAEVSPNFKTVSGDAGVSSAAYKLEAVLCGGPQAPTIRECVKVQAVPQFTDTDVGNVSLMSTGAKDCTGSKRLVPGFCWP